MPRKPRARKPAKKLPDHSDIIASTVRPQDVAVRRWAKRSEVENLLRRYGKWVKVAVNMRAQQMAALPVRLFRDGADAGEKSMRWKSRRIKDRARGKIMEHAGAGTRKSIGYVDDLEEITDPTHPVNVLMNRVNPWMSGSGFMESIEAAGCLAGNAYAAMVIPPAVGYPTELWSLPPQHVRIIPSRTDWIEGYQYGRGTEVERFYKPDEVIPFKRSSPQGDPWYGEGDMQACVADADLSFAMSQVALALLDNGIMPGLVFCGEDWTRDQRSEARAEFEREHQGVAKIGRSMFISGKVKLDKVQIGQYEVELLQGSDDHAREVVAACFGVPLEYMTLRPGGLGDGKGVAGNQFQTLTVLPSKRRIEDDLNGYLMPWFRNALGDDSLILCIDSPVIEDVEATERRAVALFTGNIAFRDEVRSMVQLDPIDGTNQVWAASLAAPVMATGMQLEAGKPQEPGDAQGATSGVPAGEQQAQAAPAAGPDVQQTALNGAQVASLQEMVRAAAAKEIPLEAVAPMMQISFPNTRPELIQTLITSLTGFEPAKPEPQVQPGASPPGAPDGGNPVESGPAPNGPGGKSVAASGAASRIPPILKYLSLPRGRKDDRPITPPLTRFQADLMGWFEEVGPKFAAVSNASSVQEMQAAADAVMKNDPGALERLISLVKPYTTEAYIAGNNGTIPKLEAIGKVGNSGYIGDVLPQRAINFLDTYNVRLAESVIDTVRSSVRSTIEQEVAAATQASLTEGETIIQATARIKDIMGPDSANYMAERIARTETGRAVTNGMHQAAIDSGENVGIEWVSSGDPCEVCQPYIGMVTRPGVPFGQNDYGPIMGADAHPNDSCSTTIVTMEGPPDV